MSSAYDKMDHIKVIENLDQPIVESYLNNKSWDKTKRCEDKKWNGKLRMMFNGDIILPYSCAFVLKRFEDFDSANFKATVVMTLVIRIKFTELDEFCDEEHMKQCMDKVEKD